MNETSKYFVQVRRAYWSEGPSHVWHMDGFDKLKPYGIAVHGCIDGYSRKVLWLKVCEVYVNIIIIFDCLKLCGTLGIIISTSLDL